MDTPLSVLKEFVAALSSPRADLRDLNKRREAAKKAFLKAKRLIAEAESVTMRPGPQGCNHVAPTLAEQLKRIHKPAAPPNGTAPARKVTP